MLAGEGGLIDSWCSGHGCVCHVFVIPDFTGSALNGRNLQRGKRKGTTQSSVTVIFKDQTLVFCKLINLRNFRLYRMQGQVKPEMLSSKYNVPRRF